MSAEGNMPMRCKRLTFWGADEYDDSLPRSVIAGRKTVTADTVEAYDQQQRLRCRIRATKVYNIRFGDVPEEVWRGEAFASAGEFREVHVRALAPLVLHDDFELVTLHFELVDVVMPFD